MFPDRGRDRRPRSAGQVAAALQCNSLLVVRIKQPRYIAVIDEHGLSPLGRHARARTLWTRLQPPSARLTERGLRRGPALGRAGGLQVNSSSRNAQQRPKCKLRRHSIMRRSLGRFTSAQRRPECKLRRHMPIRLPLATPSPALNEGRSASSGDPSAHCIECSGRLLTAQQRPERKLQRHLASTVLSCASLPRSTKARVQTPATLLDFGQDTRLKPLCATYQFSGSFARSIWTLLHMQSRLFCMLAQLNKMKSNNNFRISGGSRARVYSTHGCPSLWPRSRPNRNVES